MDSLSPVLCLQKPIKIFHCHSAGPRRRAGAGAGTIFVRAAAAATARLGYEVEMLTLEPCAELRRFYPAAGRSCAPQQLVQLGSAASWAALALHSSYTPHTLHIPHTISRYYIDIIDIL